MGAIYADIVITCFLCLDKDNTRFGDEEDFLYKDNMVVGVRYIEKVCTTRELCQPTSLMRVDTRTFGGDKFLKHWRRVLASI
jgi:hypothetical protein